MCYRHSPRPTLPPRSMSKHPLRASTRGLVLALCAIPAGALHDDDPKILDRQARYEGHGFRSARVRGGPVTALASEQFACQNVTLLSWITLGEFGSSGGNDCWGYTSPSGREYALMGLVDGLGVVEITNPGDPQILTKISGPSSLWRDVKVYQQFAYVVSEGGGGIQVLNLTNIDNGVVNLTNTVTTGGTEATHNVAIDETSGFLYRTGGSSNGLRMYSLANPGNPQWVATWDDRYVHDAQIVTYTSGPFAGRQIAFCNSGLNGGGTNTRVEVLDVTNKNNVQVLDTVFYPNAAYSHQSWLSEDRAYLYVNDELDEGGLPTTTHIIDVSNINNLVYKGSFTNGNSAIGHNCYVKGDRLFEANYRSGLRVFDISSPENPVEEAWFDTYPDNDSASFNGLWSTFPFFDSGVVIGSDMERGLFVWWVGQPELTYNYPSGVPSLVDPSGDTVVVQINELNPGSLIGAPQLHWDLGDGQGTQTKDLVSLGGNSFLIELPEAPCGASFQWWLSAQSTGGLTWSDPGGEPYTSTAALGETVAINTVETSFGWSVGAPGDDASTGVWTHGNPIGTGSQPEDDHTVGGSSCWFTGQGSPGGSVGENDIDGGVTSLISPAFNLAGMADPVMRYWRWYSNVGGNSPGEDVFEIQISNNNGASWVPLETVGPTGPEAGGGWFQHSFRVADFVAPSAFVKLRFQASDEGDGSIVEAAVDDIQVVDFFCPPLAVDTVTLSVSQGGVQNFTLNAGATHAGELYVLLGSATGTSPGTPVGALNLPLVSDGWTNFTLANPNSGPLSGFTGLLDGGGQGSAMLGLPSGSSASLAGLKLYHAYPLIDLGGNGFTFVSNAVSVTLVP